MTKVLIDLSTVEKALDSLEYENSWHETYKVRPYVSTIDSIAALRAVLAEPVQEPTKAMIDAAERIDWSDADVRGNIINMWQAMIAAAPQPAQQQEPGRLEDFLNKSRAFAHNELSYYRQMTTVEQHDIKGLKMRSESPAQPTQEPLQETNDIVKQLADALDSVQFYQRRCEALQSWQSKMRDPERTIVCDILANGFTLDPAFAGDRYAAPPQRKPLTSDKDRPDQNATYVEGYGYVDTRAVRAVERAHGIKE